jgi:hypothetical protein
MRIQLMARSAALQDEDSQAALLEAKLKAWFTALASQPVPAHILRHVDRLDREAGYGRPQPETR